VSVVIPALKLTGSEELRQVDAPCTVLHFWQWAMSNLADNVTRGVLAEFLVAHALGLTETPRGAWDAFDLRLPDGPTIEVKSSAFIQSWAQRSPSKPSFSIAPTQAWDGETGRYAAETKRQADVYVFALLAHTDRNTLRPLDLAQWEFYVVATVRLNERCGTQRRIGLAGVKLLAGSSVAFANLRKAVEDTYWMSRSAPGSRRT
jgi:hypothetical protein